MLRYLCALRGLILICGFILYQPVVFSAQLPGYQEGDIYVRDFKFSSGHILPRLKLHYITLGSPKRDANGQIDNAVLMLHGTGSSGASFLIPSISDYLFKPTMPLDLNKYYIILPDAIGAGLSSKPSDGLKADFPAYQYEDIVRAQYLQVTAGLGVRHLRLVTGTSMGGMLTWMWGELYPDMMDALLPVASLPVTIRGRNLIWRRAIVAAIKHDPDWDDGYYTRQPHAWGVTFPMMRILADSPGHLLPLAETPADADKLVEDSIQQSVKVDANDFLYALSSSSDYHPENALDKIEAHLFAVNFADDEFNPIELGVMEKMMPQVKNGGYVVIPSSTETQGHSSLVLAKLWSPYLAKLLN